MLSRTWRLSMRGQSHDAHYTQCVPQMFVRERSCSQCPHPQLTPRQQIRCSGCCRNAHAVCEGNVMRLTMRSAAALCRPVMRTHPARATSFDVYVASCQVLYSVTDTYTRSVLRLTTNRGLPMFPSGSGKLLNALLHYMAHVVAVRMHLLYMTSARAQGVPRHRVAHGVGEAYGRNRLRAA